MRLFFIVTISTIVVAAIQVVSAKSGDATYYDLGMTACGKVFSDNDLVAAISFSYWKTPNPNVDPMCDKSARVTDPKTGRSVIVRIKDKCSGCKAGDIDLSKAAFLKLKDNLGVGRFRVNWDFV